MPSGSNLKPLVGGKKDDVPRHLAADGGAEAPSKAAEPLLRTFRVVAISKRASEGTRCETATWNSGSSGRTYRCVDVSDALQDAGVRSVLHSALYELRRTDDEAQGDTWQKTTHNRSSRHKLEGGRLQRV